MLIPPDVLSGFTLDARVDITLAPKQSTDFSEQRARKESKQRVCRGLLLRLHSTSRKEYVWSKEQDSLRDSFSKHAKGSQTRTDQVQIRLCLRTPSAETKSQPWKDLIQNGRDATTRTVHESERVHLRVDCDAVWACTAERCGYDGSAIPLQWAAHPYRQPPAPGS